MGVGLHGACVASSLRARVVTGDRMHDGPMPGSYLITVELEPDTDPDAWMALMTAFRTIAREMVKGDIYVHGQRLMKGKGKHASADYDSRLES